MRTALALFVGCCVLFGCGDPAPEAPDAPEPVPLAGVVPESGDPKPAAEEAPTIEVRLLENGEALLFDAEGGLEGSAVLGAEAPAVADAGLTWLRETLARRTEDPRWREADGSSRITLEIEGAAVAKWRYAQWILQTAAHPDVQIYRIRLLETGDERAYALALPKDRGVPFDLLEEEIEETTAEVQLPDSEVAGEDPVIRDEGDVDTPFRAPVPPSFVDDTPQLAVNLFRKDVSDPNTAFTRIRIAQSHTFELPRGWLPGDPEWRTAHEQTFTQLTDVLTVMRDAASFGIRGHVATPPPQGPHVPYGDVLRVLRAFEDAGIERVTLEGAPMPLGR
ncbi:MAG: hypothetical protein ACYTG6_09150 [Planctomycetota bacterium]|jgi:hypothetical protein